MYKGTEVESPQISEKCTAQEQKNESAVGQNAPGRAKKTIQKGGTKEPEVYQVLVTYFYKKI